MDRDMLRAIINSYTKVLEELKDIKESVKTIVKQQKAASKKSVALNSPYMSHIPVNFTQESIKDNTRMQKTHEKIFVKNLDYNLDTKQLEANYEEQEMAQYEIYKGSSPTQMDQYSTYYNNNNDQRLAAKTPTKMSRTRKKSTQNNAEIEQNNIQDLDNRCNYTAHDATLANLERDERIQKGQKTKKHSPKTRSLNTNEKTKMQYFPTQYAKEEIASFTNQIANAKTPAHKKSPKKAQKQVFASIAGHNTFKTSILTPIQIKDERMDKACRDTFSNLSGVHKMASQANAKVHNIEQPHSGLVSSNIQKQNIASQAIKRLSGAKDLKKSCDSINDAYKISLSVNSGIADTSSLLHDINMNDDAEIGKLQLLKNVNNMNNNKNLITNNFLGQACAANTFVKVKKQNRKPTINIFDHNQKEVADNKDSTGIRKRRKRTKLQDKEDINIQQLRFADEKSELWDVRGTKRENGTPTRNTHTNHAKKAFRKYIDSGLGLGKTEQSESVSQSNLTLVIDDHAQKQKEENVITEPVEALMAKEVSLNITNTFLQEIEEEENDKKN